MAMFAVYTLRVALEDPCEDAFGIWEADMWIPAAATFINIAGAKIYGLCANQIETTGLGSMSGRLWRGDNRLTIERWNFWKARFREFATIGGVGEGCKIAAGEAFISMVRVERAVP